MSPLIGSSHRHSYVSGLLLFVRKVSLFFNRLSYIKLFFCSSSLFVIGLIWLFKKYKFYIQVCNASLDVKESQRS